MKQIITLSLLVLAVLFTIALLPDADVRAPAPLVTRVAAKPANSACLTLPGAEADAVATRKVARVLPAVNYLMADCKSCCDTVWFSYLRCRTNRNSICDCIIEAWNSCAFNCAPCNCCTQWLEAGETQNCQ